jgi:adenylate cyclase
VLGQRLTGEERRRRRIQEALGRYVSDAVAARLAEAAEPPNLGGEAATVTVLFSDIRNFTTLSERLAPEEVVEMLNAYFSRVVERILALDGTVDKFIGDAVMAVFGLPAPAPDDALRALRAALALTEEAAAFQGWMDRRFPGRDCPASPSGWACTPGGWWPATSARPAAWSTPPSATR